jgi:hypothetical protein
MGEIGEFWRDVKEDRERRKLKNPPPKRRCWDWMIVSGTCHYAKDRSSFKTYRPLGKTIKGKVFGSHVYVAGIGAVELNLRSSSKKGSPDRVLVLESVLHIPSAICNGFHWMKYQRENGGSVYTEDNWKGSDDVGRPLWYGKPFCGLHKLALAGNPQGESYLKEDGEYVLSMYISMEDPER